jgi:hypothetical protein
MTSTELRALNHLSTLSCKGYNCRHHYDVPTEDYVSWAREASLIVREVHISCPKCGSNIFSPTCEMSEYLGDRFPQWKKFRNTLIGLLERLERLKATRGDINRRANIIRSIFDHELSNKFLLKLTGSSFLLTNYNKLVDWNSHDRDGYIPGDKLAEYDMSEEYGPKFYPE